MNKKNAYITEEESKMAEADIKKQIKCIKDELQESMHFTKKNLSDKISIMKEGDVNGDECL